MTVSPFPLFIMHYCVFVFIPKKGELDELVAAALQPFDEEREVDPHKVYLGLDEIEAMAQHYRVGKNDIPSLVPHMQDWRGGPGGLDETGLFVVSTWNPLGKWDWYDIGGRWHGLLRGNVVRARTLVHAPNLDAILPAAVVTPDGAWIERTSYVSTGWLQGYLDRKTDRTWRREVREALGSHPDFRVVCVDVHR